MNKDSFVTSQLMEWSFLRINLDHGNLVIIENDEGFYCVLSGMKNILISSGIEVLKGEPIAKVVQTQQPTLF